MRAKIDEGSLSAEHDRQKATERIRNALFDTQIKGKDAVVDGNGTIVCSGIKDIDKAVEEWKKALQVHAETCKRLITNAEERIRNDRVDCRGIQWGDDQLCGCGPEATIADLASKLRGEV